MGWLRKTETPPGEQFASSVLQHLDALYANALHLTRSRADAEDLVQDTVVKAYRFHDRFEQGTNLKGWLFRIQYNNFVNQYRRAARQSAIVESSLTQDLARDFLSADTLGALTDPEQNALRPLAARELREAFEELSEEFRSILLLADVEEFTYREIADVFGCPIGTVMSRLHRARRALRKSFLQRTRQDQPADEGQDSAGQQAVSLEAFRRQRSKG